MISWFDADEQSIDEARSLNTGIEDMLRSAPPLESVPPHQTRAARRRGEGWMGQVVHVEEATDRRIDTDIGPITLRTIVPDRVDAVYLHIHGGGFVLGAADQQDVLLRTIATRANCAVLSVEYRLAPEHPFPAGPDDCEAAARWLVDHAGAEFGTERLIIGGESAGAHLAATTLLRLRDRTGTAAPFVGANLVFGIYDLSGTPSNRNWGDRALLLTRGGMDFFNDCFVPGRDAEARRDRDVSPLYADLGGLVPALFTVGELDPLLDDSLFMGARWAAAGNPAEVVVFPESPHGFVALPTALGRAAIDGQVRFIASLAAH